MSRRPGAHLPDSGVARAAYDAEMRGHAAGGQMMPPWLWLWLIGYLAVLIPAEVSNERHQIVNRSSSVYGIPAVTCGAISPCPVYRAIWWRSLLTSAGISTARSPTSHSHNHGGIICSPVA